MRPPPVRRWITAITIAFLAVASLGDGDGATPVTVLADRVEFPGHGSSALRAIDVDDPALTDLSETELTDALLRELDETGY